MMELAERIRSHWKVLILACGTIFLFWIVGQIFKDKTWVLGLMFYIPSPVLSVGLLTIAAYSKWRRIPGWKHIGAMAILPLLFVIVVENRWLPNGPVNLSGNVRRLVHWNICRTNMGWDRQKAVLLNLKPDVIVLSEVTDEVTPEDFEGYQVRKRSGMLVACRGSIVEYGQLATRGVVSAFQVRCEMEGYSFNLMVADHTSSLGAWREPGLRRLTTLISEQQPDCVVGDLNAPRLSGALCDLPRGFRHAYDAAGSGYSYTWPVPIPFLAIDQCMCGPRIVPVHYELQSTLLSDHRIQVLDFTESPAD
jgi:hypothetical protein